MPPKKKQSRMPPKKKQSRKRKHSPSPSSPPTSSPTSPPQKRRTKKRRRTSPSYSAVLTIVDNESIIYHEGGDSYRPFIVVNVPVAVWVGNRLAFYKSSGRSNVGYELYANTWFPTGGIIKTEFVHRKDKLERGLIIKISTLYNLKDKYSPTWIYNLLREYFVKKYTVIPASIMEDIFFVTTDVSALKKKTVENAQYIELYNEIYQEYLTLYKFLYNYFFNEFQIKISAALGGGYWTINENFYNFITARAKLLALQFAPENIDFVKNIVVPTESSNSPENSGEVIEFLERKEACYEPNTITPYYESIMTPDNISMNSFLITTYNYNTATQQLRIHKLLSKKK
jgi:hypothetical protein